MGRTQKWLAVWPTELWPVAAFSRYTFIKKSYLGLWAEGALGYYNNFVTYNADHALPVERRTQGGLVSVRPGLVFYATRHLQLEMSCGTLLYQLGQSEYTNLRHPFTTLRTMEHITEVSLSNAFNVAVNWQF